MTYPPPPGDYPPQPGGYPPPGNYPPPPGNYPAPGSYPPPPPANYPSPGGYPPAPGNYPPAGNYPPPPAGNYPLPPPGNYPPPPPGYGMAPNAVGTLPQDAYTSWGKRVVAALIDAAPVLVVYGLATVFAVATGERHCFGSQYGYGGSCVVTYSAAGSLVILLAWLAMMGYGIWNYGYRQGTTGSSIGKSVMKFKVVSETTGQPIGFGLSIVRQLAHFIDSFILCIGYLFPLWDAKRQTLADKIMTTVCLPTA